MQDHIWKKALLYTKAFQRTHMSRREAGVLYRSCFLPALTYSFPAMGLPPTFLERIHKLSTSTILNKMGYHRNLPRSVVFAPCRIGGIGLCNLIQEQSAQQTIILLRHLRAKSSLGKAMEALIRTYQLWAGLRRHVLFDTQPCPWIPSQWLSHLRQSMQTNQVQICYNAWTIQPMRANDRFIMEDLLDQDLPRFKLERLNACRMYLQVTTLAEITDHTGFELLPQALTNQRQATPTGLTSISYSKLKWPRINCPSAACWRLWTATIRTIYTGSARGTRLNQPLGPWYEAHHATVRYWNWRMHDPTHLVFSAAPMATTRVALPTMTRRTTMKFSPTVPTTLDFSGPPVTPIDPNMGYIRLPIQPIELTPSKQSTATHYKTLQQQFRTSLPEWQCIMFGSLRKAYSTNTLYGKLVTKTPVMIVSDASVQNDGQSGFAWVIAEKLNPLWRGLGLAPGPAEDMYSGRAEAFGLLAAISFIQYYLSCYPPLPDNATIPCYCDNLGVITTLTTLTQQTIPRPNDTTNDDRDIYLAIIDVVNRCTSITFKYHHVKGHQDTNPQHQLTIPEQHNVDCNQQAKTFVSTHRLRSTAMSNPAFHAAEPHLKIAGKVISRCVLQHLRYAAATPDYWTYLRQRFNWTQADLLGIHWASLTTALNSFPRNDQRRIVLFIHDKLALRTSKFHPHVGSSLCPSCQREPEDKWHFLECQNPERRTLFTKLKGILTSITTKYFLHPAILTTFWLGLLTIRNDTRYPNITNDIPPILSTTIQAQTRLGWDQLYHGRVSGMWAQAIDYLNPHLRINGRYIVVQMIKAVWAYVLTTWTTRNQHLHRNGGQLSQPNYQQAVRTIYEQKSSLPQEVQDALFHRPLEQMLEQPPTFLQRWIERSQRYIRQQLKAAKKRAKLNTHDIRSFFHCHGPPADDLHPP